MDTAYEKAYNAGYTNGYTKGSNNYAPRKGQWKPYPEDNLWQCPFCGNVEMERDNFCRECGADLR